MTAKNAHNAVFALLFTAAITLSVVGAVDAEVIFYESFEIPDITGSEKISDPYHPSQVITLPGWVGVARYTGLVDRDNYQPGSEQFINSFGDQVAYIFNNLPVDDTGSSLTTTSEGLDAVLQANTAYTLTFNAASDDSYSTNYHVELLAVDGSAETVLGVADAAVVSIDMLENVGSILVSTGDTHENLGQRLAVRLKKGYGWWESNLFYDNVTLSADPIAYWPEDGEVVSAGQLELRWTNVEPVTPPVYVDVWFGTDPGDTTGQDYVRVVAGVADKTTVNVNAPIVGQTYYWQVNSYLGGNPRGVPTEGPVHSFMTSDLPPSSVDAGPDMVTWSGRSLQLDATIEDDGASHLSCFWSADPADGVVFDSSSAEDPNVTISKAPGDSATVVLTLAVHDACNVEPLEDSLVIEVYDDACQAARIGKWRLPDHPTDLDGNCITDFIDFALLARQWPDDYSFRELALLAAEWLDDYTLTGTVSGDIGIEAEDEQELLSAIAALKEHITGVAILDAGQIETYKWTVDLHSSIFGANETVIAACFDLVETYDSVIGPIWVDGSPKQGGFDRSDAVADNDIHWTTYCIMQHIMDITYNARNILRYPSLFDGFKFSSSACFPGAVDPPANPNAAYTALIDASYPKQWGRHTMYTTSPARRPTGTYLAPGTIATVAVPLSIVGKGYRIRVGAHTWDLSGKSSVKRMDRCTLAYDIDCTEVKVANPLGGGIYIEVPYESDVGIVPVHVRGAVRSPFFSAKSFHSTSLFQWQRTERRHRAPWADFQSEKFMFNVPTSWIYDFDDPVTLMAKWDAAMDVMNDLMGYPHLRGKETMYPQVDVLLRANFFAPGYPSVNIKYDPRGSYDGNVGNFLLTGPENAPDYLFHEEGHAYRFRKFPGETNESAVNLHHVAVQNQACGKTLDEAFRASRGFSNTFKTLDNTAVTWMTVFNFSPRQVPMADGEKAYQLKGHAKYVEIARIFGWQVLNDFWYSLNDDYESGVSSDTSTDGQILRFSRMAGCDLRPLFHFWGTHPSSPASLAAAIKAEDLPQSAEIYDMLVRYRSLVPVDNRAFQAFALNWWGKKPSINGYWTEREHARQWDNELLWDPPELPNGEIYDESSCARIKAVIDALITLYFPNGRP